MRHTVITDTFTTVTVVYAVPTTPGRCRLMAGFRAWRRSLRAEGVCLGVHGVET
jgi:hypothetical protein